MTPRLEDRLLVLLAFAAGAVDAISFLGLDEVFTANMTGNTVLLGLALGQGEFGAVWHSAASLGGFVVGAAAATAIVESPADASAGTVAWPSRVTVAIALECALLAAFAVAWAIAGAERSNATAYGLIVLASCAMGVQSAAVRRLHVPDVLTIVITGTITSVVGRLTLRARPGHAPPPAGAGPGLDVRTAVIGAVALGAVAGGAVELHAYGAAAVLPLAAVGCVAVATMWLRPRTA